jgi:uncharacterized repeat protein (TIGR03803 family)
MWCRQQNFLLTSGAGPSAANAAWATAIVLVASIFWLPPAQAQTFQVIHSFNAGGDGARPLAGVTLDAEGNLYGTAEYGALTSPMCYSGGCGTVYQMKHSGSGWILTPLYSFHGYDGANPLARVMFGANGTLYGTTESGGHGNCAFLGSGCGIIFNLKPPATVCKTAVCPWTATVLYEFTGLTDGGEPGTGDLNFDQSGNVYGTTVYGGYTGDSCPASSQGCGVVFELTRSGGSWSESVLHQFFGAGDGEYPEAGAIFDNAGNLYGSASRGGNIQWDGSTYELMPSGSGWEETTLYAFPIQGPDGNVVAGGLIFDRQGNLYGSTEVGGSHFGGTVFELSPSNGNWTPTVLWNFSGNGGSLASLTMDALGNLYGTTYADGSSQKGNVFKLSPSGQGWTYTSLHDFTGGSDGAYPIGGVSLDAHGNLYGTTSSGGTGSACNGGCGVVWEITP